MNVRGFAADELLTYGFIIGVKLRNEHPMTRGQITDYRKRNLEVVGRRVGKHELNDSIVGLVELAIS